MEEDRITLRLPRDLRRQARVEAAEQDQSMNAWIVEAIREKMQSQRQTANRAWSDTLKRHVTIPED